MEKTATYVLDGKRREDGTLYITSNDLPGFHLIVGPDENLEEEVKAALGIFYPLFMAAKAREEAQGNLLRVTSDFALRHRDGDRDVRLSAAFELA